MMKISYTTAENDLVTYQLYTASTSERIRKKRSRNTLLWPMIYVLCGIAAYFPKHRIDSSVLFFSVAILWLVFYPMWEKRNYMNTYRNFVRDRLKDKIGEEGTVEFGDDFIRAFNDTGESKIMNTQIVDICEIPSIIMINLKGGQALILPKSIREIDEVKTKLKQLAGELNVEYANNENWKWK